MYAIVEIAGQQFKVEKDQQIFVHRLEAKEGSKVDFDKVLLMDDSGKVNVGAPVIKGAKVTVKVLEHLKGDKVIVFKKKRRKGYKVKNGHRQYLTKLEIQKIDTKAPSAKKAAPKKEAKPAAKKATVKKKTTAKKPATKKDLLIVASGSGESIIPLSIAKKAKLHKTKIALITSAETSSLKKISDIYVTLKAPTKSLTHGKIRIQSLADEASKSSNSVQPMSTLFDQALHIYGDIISLMIFDQKKYNKNIIWKYHANLE